MKNALLNDQFFNRLETMNLNLRKNLTGYFGGKHLVSTYGQTVEFADYREYQLGDDIRRIDWNLYSRFEKYFLKLFTDERQMQIQIFLDCSASMGKDNDKKAQYAVACAAALGYLSVHNMDKVSMNLMKENGNENPFGTIVLCLLKTGLAGLVAGFVFKAFAFFGKKQPEKKNRVIFFAIGIIASALLVPVINTGVFILGAFAFFREPMGGTFAKILAAVLTTNFLIEFLFSAIMSPALVSLVKVLTKNYDLGFVNDFSSFIDNDEDEAFSEAVSL